MENKVIFIQGSGLKINIQEGASNNEIQEGASNNEIQEGASNNEIQKEKIAGIFSELQNYIKKII